ncbi:MAG: hypothetical protein ACXVZV_10295 [Terriglobales bacterium]
MLKEIDAVAKDFAAKASHKKLHPKVREFLQLAPTVALKWISDNVSHSNVASYALTSPTLVNASTATQIISKLPLK